MNDKQLTALTLERLHYAGWYVRNVEVKSTYKTVDLLGFIDILALRPGQTLGVQVTTGTNAAARVKKILGPNRFAATAWLEAGNAIEVWGWRTLKAEGFVPRIIPITRDQL